MRGLVVAFVGVMVMTACSLVSPQGCPAALLQGVLAADDRGGALLMTEFGPQPVRWPDGYRVDSDPDVVLRDERGGVVAVEGDTLYVGGGMDAANEAFVACGYVSRDPP